MNPWRRSIADYTDRRVMLILPLGFASGLPLLLTFSTLSAWLATAGVSRAAIGAFALVGTPYALQVPVVAADRSAAAADCRLGGGAAGASRFSSR